MFRCISFLFFFFFNDTATTEIYTLSLHDALPISAGTGIGRSRVIEQSRFAAGGVREEGARASPGRRNRSEEHTSELQSQSNLVCRLLLEKKKKGENDSIFGCASTCTTPRLHR